MKRLRITVNGQPYDVTVEEISSEASAPVAAPSAVPVPKASPVAPVQGVTVKAPMPGTVLKVEATVGKQVKAGDILVVLEAMKMENEILAPQDGRVAAVQCTQGNSVNAEDVLVVLN